MGLRQVSVATAALVAVVAAALTSLVFGAVHVPLSDVIGSLDGHTPDGPLREIVVTLRVPRTVSALLVGAGLGVAGTLLQAALHNPLASPDVIGVTSGAGFGAVLILLVLPGSIALLPVAALVFGLVAATMVFVIAWAGPGGGGVGRLLLAGIAVGSLFTAATTSLMVSFADRVQSAVFFIAGGLSSDGWDTLRVTWPYFAAGFVLAVLLARPLDRLALGDDVAASLGARPRLVRLAAASAAALLAAAAASIAGLLGFLGLLTPHLVRMASDRTDTGYVAAVSALCGAALLLFADTLARVVAAPRELPVGPFMVVLGVPVFLWLLRRTVPS